MGEYVGATVLTSTSCGLAPGLRGSPTASHGRVQLGHNYKIGTLETSTRLLSFQEIESINILNEAEGKRQSEMHMMANDGKAREARERLQRNLAIHGFKKEEVPREGNCQFCAVLQQTSISGDQHLALRKLVHLWMETNENRYMNFVHKFWPTYLECLAAPGEWGDDVTLQAMLDMFDVSGTIISDAVNPEHAVTRKPPNPQEQFYEGRGRAAFLDLAHGIDEEHGNLYMDILCSFANRQLYFAFTREKHYEVAVPLSPIVKHRPPDCLVNTRSVGKCM